jgi:predicted RNA polymerase sigma factor
MPQNVPEELSRTIETLYRSESGRILATLARLLGDLDVAEEAMHEALPLLWTRGLRPAYRINRAPGSFQPRASKL